MILPGKNNCLIIVSVLFLTACFHTSASADLQTNDINKKPVKIDFNDIYDNNSDLKSPDTNTLKIAVAAMISPEYTYKNYIQLLSLIGSRMGKKVIFVQKKTYEEVNKMLSIKEVELAFVCSGPYVSGRKEFGLEILVVPVCHGKKVYYSYFIASSGSGMKSFDEMRGKTFAFTDPLSNTGFLVPSYYLALRKETPGKFFKKTFFSHSHDNSIKAVANGLADGAAVDSLIFNFMCSENPELIKKVTIIDKSPPYGIPPVVVHPSMQAAEKNRLKKIFLSIHKLPEGKRILDNIQIDYFTEGNDTDYNTVRELQNYLEQRSK